MPSEIYLSDKIILVESNFVKVYTLATTTGTRTLARLMAESIGANTVYDADSSTAIIAFAANEVFLNDGVNLATDTTNGSKIASATSQKIGFWGKTPIVQPSSTGVTAGFTAGAGTNVTDQSTFTGNTGSKAYTLGDIVFHLKTMGLLQA